MENASKALLMAGGILIALLIIGALLLMFNNLSTYQKIGEQDTREAQVIEFNNQFTTYLRDRIRGSDMVSLMNRIVDYNERQSSDNGQKFEKMEITIKGIDVSKLQYDTGNKKIAIIKNSYTQDTINELLTIAQDLERKYQSKYITTLSASINKIMDSEEETKKLLPESLWNQFEYDKIKEDVAKYYQYSQFKRVYFNCNTNATKYNPNTGRIVKLEFTCTNQMN